MFGITYKVGVKMLTGWWFLAADLLAVDKA